MKLTKKQLRWAAVPALLVSLLTSGCASTAPEATGANPETIRVGYFANLTHAPALVAAQEKLWDKYLPEGVEVEPFIFNAGSAAVEAFKGGALDVSYIGPNPAIAGYNTTDGELLRIVSGATSGGAAFITTPDIKTAADLKGKNIATPALGNTQDVALKSWLSKEGLTEDVTVTPTENSTTLALFQSGDIDGAWVPEPWASRLVLEGGGSVFLDESSLWDEGKFVTTHIVAETSFLTKYPALVTALIKANEEALGIIAADPERAKADVQAELLAQTGKQLSDEVIDRAWESLTFTHDPLAATLKHSADSAVEAGLLALKSGGLNSIYDLTLLNAELAGKNEEAVSAAGLGKQ